MSRRPAHRDANGNLRTRGIIVGRRCNRFTCACGSNMPTYLSGVCGRSGCNTRICAKCWHSNTCPACLKNPRNYDADTPPPHLRE